MLDEPSRLANTGFEFRLEFRRRSLTWSLRGKTVLIHKGREVARLGKVLLVQVQLRFHVLQGGPLVAGGGGQLLFVRGVVVLRVGAAFIHRHRILQRGEVSVGSSSHGGDGWTRKRAPTGERSDSGDFFGDLFTLKVLLRQRQSS